MTTQKKKHHVKQKVVSRIPNQYYSVIYTYTVLHVLPICLLPYGEVNANILWANEGTARRYRHVLLQGDNF